MVSITHTQELSHLLESRQRTSSFASAAKSSSSAQNPAFVLHIGGKSDGQDAITAQAFSDGTSISVYQSESFSETDPVYRVKIWAADGTEQERDIHLNDVNPASADYMELTALSAHVTGSVPLASAFFSNKSTGMTDDVMQEVFEKKNYMDLLAFYADSQRLVGNYSRYQKLSILYQKLVDWDSSSTAETEGKNQTATSDQTDENTTESDIMVKSDGSRVLILTTKFGGMESTTSILLSKPTSQANDIHAEQGMENKQASADVPLTQEQWNLLSPES